MTDGQAAPPLAASAQVVDHDDNHAGIAQPVPLNTRRGAAATADHRRTCRRTERSRVCRPAHAVYREFERRLYGFRSSWLIQAFADVGPSVGNCTSHSAKSSTGSTRSRRKGDEQMGLVGA